MPTSRISLRQLLEKTKHCIVIPSYQRRYIWGQQKRGAKNSAAKLLNSIIEEESKGGSIFLQGITLSKDKGKWHLVDGQQRLTFLYLLLYYLYPDKSFFTIKYDCRPIAEKWLSDPSSFDKNNENLTQDTFYFSQTIKSIEKQLGKSNTTINADFLLDNIFFLCIELSEKEQAIAAFQMMNGTKSSMYACDVIKADLMRMASDPAQPETNEWNINSLRARYASEWESWLRWWNTPEVSNYFGIKDEEPLGLFLRLGLREKGADYSTKITYEEFQIAIQQYNCETYHAAKHFFAKLRRTQKRFEEAYENATSYNQIKAVLLLQEPQAQFDFLHLFFIDHEIDAEELERYYKLSFLGMSIDEIHSHQPMAAKLDDLIATLSMADVYHSEAKREAFNLLLRLNIDEDIKLGRRFDFNIWNNRSLEHIYSKSRVWHRNPDGRVFDGNDNELRISYHKLETDPAYLRRDEIATKEGVQLSEHCIGNLVLLYGQNNARFGNADFDEKKLLFLTPGDMGIFQSRNLLHSVCVFAGNNWNSQSIVDNYNLTLRNLRLYYDKI